MQQCLNDDANYFYKKFKKYPALLVLLVFFIALGIVLTTVGVLCKNKFPCSEEQFYFSLFVGVNLCIFTVVFIVIPCCIRSTLNCVYQVEEQVYVRRSPLTVRRRPPVITLGLR